MNSARICWSRRSSDTSSRTSHAPLTGERRARTRSFGSVGVGDGHLAGRGARSRAPTGRSPRSGRRRTPRGPAGRASSPAAGAGRRGPRCSRRRPRASSVRWTMPTPDELDEDGRGRGHPARLGARARRPAPGGPGCAARGRRGRGARRAGRSRRSATRLADGHGDGHDDHATATASATATGSMRASIAQRRPGGGIPERRPSPRRRTRRDGPAVGPGLFVERRDAGPSGHRDLPGHVVAVLLGPEDPPRESVAVAERTRHIGPEEPADGRVAVRDVEPGDLVVALVLEARACRAAPSRSSPTRRGPRRGSGSASAARGRRTSRR